MAENPASASRLLATAPVTVCVCTYRRPRQLAQLLDRLAQQRGPASFGEVVVVDNDAAASARPVVESARARGLPFEVRYDVQPEKSLAVARNRSVALASGQWIAFIDDDELPSQDWLRRMVETASDYRATGAMGPVISLVPESAPRWIRRGRFYDRRRFRTGTVVPRNQFRTSNALCAADWLRRIEGPFDPEYGLTGGEDVRMFNLLANLGARFVWCDDAVVEEAIGEDRLSLRWLLMRRFRGGNDFARLTVSGALGPVRPWTVPILAARALAQMIIAGLLSVASLPFGIQHSAAWLFRVVSNAGKLAALARLHYREYA